MFHEDGLTDGQADVTKLIVALRNFTNAAKKEKETALCVHYGNCLVDHRQWASEHNTKIAECIIIYKNQSSGLQPLGHGIHGGRTFIPK
jgi:hypothetical protein